MHRDHLLRFSLTDGFGLLGRVAGCRSQKQTLSFFYLARFPSGEVHNSSSSLERHLSWIKPVLLSSEQTIGRKSDGIAGLFVLACSLANRLACLPFFCFRAHHFLLPLSCCTLLCQSAVLRSYNLPSAALSLGGNMAA